jgi:uncharacterized SAM-binding protein YcdF (DUF218 family)
MKNPKKKLIVTFGGGITRDGLLFISSKTNVEKAVELFKEDPKQYIIVSGRYGYAIGYRPPKTEAKAMKEYAISLGVPASQIIMEQNSLDTVGNVYFVDKIVNRMKNVKSIRVVALYFHMKRSEYIFKKMFGNRYKIKFIKSHPDLPKERVKGIISREKGRLNLIRKLYGSVKEGDDAEFRRRIEKWHPLYAKNLNTVPDIVWEHFMAGGFEKSGLETRD